MTVSKIRISKVGMIAGLVVLVLLLGVTQLSLAGDLEYSVTTYRSFVARSAAEDLSCTGGPTGGCSVSYKNVNLTDPQAGCGASACKVRVELRW